MFFEAENLNKKYNTPYQAKGGGDGLCDTQVKQTERHNQITRLARNV